MRKRKSFGFIILLAINLILPSAALSQVKINEFVPRADTEWVEFYNANNSAEYLKSYWIDDDTSFDDDVGQPKKLLDTINSTSIGFPYFEINSRFFNDDGDFVVLFDDLGNIVDQFEYRENVPADLSYGRSPDGTGTLQLLEKTTKGSSNASPKPSNTPTSVPHTQPPSIAATPTITSTPTATPNKTTPPTKKPTPRLSPSPTSAEVTVEKAPEVLSLASEEVLSTPTPLVEGDSTAKRVNPLSVALLIAGSVIILFALGLFVKNKSSQTKKPFDDTSEHEAID